MYKYTRINENSAVKTWSGQLNEAFGKQLGGNPTFGQKVEMISKLAAIKHAIDGPVNTSEKSLLENYAISGPTNILGMGPAQWPSDPGTSPGNQPGAWGRSDYKRGSGDVPTMIMGLAMNVAAYTVAFDIVNTIPVDLPTYFFQFLDSVYAGGHLTEAGAPPVYAKFKSPVLNAQFDYKPYKYGDQVFLAGTEGVISGQYMGKSVFDGSIILKLTSTGTETSGTYTADNAKSIVEITSGALTIDLGTDATTLAGNPVSIGEAKADLVESFAEHIQGFSNSDQVTKRRMDRATGEKGTTSKLNLRLWTTSGEVGDIEVLADITKTQLKDLKSYGIDGVAQLYKAAQNELIQTINDEVVQEFARLGVENHANLYAAQGLNLNLFIAPAGTANKALSDFSYGEFVDRQLNDRAAEFGAIANAENNSAAENTYTRQRRIYSRILAAASMIGTISRYGEGDVAVVGPQTAVALVDCKAFSAVPAENTIGSTGDLHFIGTIGATRIYKNPKWAWNDMRISVGRQGAQDQPGLKFFAYDLASSVEVIDSTTYAPKICVTSRYAIEACGFRPEASYLTFVIDSGFGQNQWV